MWSSVQWQNNMWLLYQDCVKNWLLLIQYNYPPWLQCAFKRKEKERERCLHLLMARGALCWSHEPDMNQISPLTVCNLQHIIFPKGWHSLAWGFVYCTFSTFLSFSHPHSITLFLDHYIFHTSHCLSTVKKSQHGNDQTNSPNLPHHAPRFPNFSVGGMNQD